MNRISRRGVIVGLPLALLLPAKRAQARGARLSLIFVAQSSCPYCQAVAPILGQMRDAGVVDVMMASMDGRAVPPFYNFEDGWSHELTRNFRTVPQVMVYHPGRDQITHVVGGVRNMRRFVLRLSHALHDAASL